MKVINLAKLLLVIVSIIAYSWISTCKTLADTTTLTPVSVHEMTEELQQADYPTPSNYTYQKDVTLNPAPLLDGNNTTGMNFYGYSYWYWNDEGSQWIACITRSVIVFEYDLSGFNTDDIQSLAISFNATDDVEKYPDFGGYGAAYVGFYGWLSGQSLGNSVYSSNTIYNAASSYGRLPKSVSVDQTITFTKTGNDGNYATGISLGSLMDQNKHVRIMASNYLNGVRADGPAITNDNDTFIVNEVTASLTFTNSNITSPSGIVSKGWNLISLPALPKNAAAASVLSGVNMVDASLQKWDNTSNTGGGYLIYNQNWDGTMNAGEAYWLIESDNKTLSFTVNANTSDDKIISIPAHSKTPYWIMVGHPFDKKIGCMNIKFKVNTDAKIWADAISAGWIEAVAQGWNSAQQSYFNVGLSSNPAVIKSYFEPWYGYWMMIKTDQPIDIIVPTSPVEI